MKNEPAKSFLIHLHFHVKTTSVDYQYCEEWRTLREKLSSRNNVENGILVKSWNLQSNFANTRISGVALNSITHHCWADHLMFSSSNFLALKFAISYGLDVEVPWCGRLEPNYSHMILSMHEKVHAPCMHLNTINCDLMASFYTVYMTVQHSPNLL